MKMRDKKDEMILTLALLEQLEKDEEIKEFECHESEGKTWSVGKSTAGEEKEERKCPPHVFSESHNRRMKQIFKMAARAEKKQKHRRIFFRAGIGFAACLCLSTAMVFSSSAFRVPVLNFFTEVKEKYSELIVDKGKKIHVTENFQEYEPEYVVRGFNVATVEETEGYFAISYIDDNGRWYDFYCYESPFNSQIDTEEVSQTNLDINGTNVTICKKDDYIQIVVYHTLYQYVLTGNISVEEASKVLQSINLFKE